MADTPLPTQEAGQYVAAAEHTIRAAAGLDPWAQVTLAAGFCAAVIAYVITRRPPASPGTETLTIVVKAMEEQARATGELAHQVEKLVEQNAAMFRERRGEAAMSHR